MNKGNSYSKYGKLNTDCNWPCYLWVSQSLSGYHWTLWQCFPFNQNFLKFGNSSKWYRNFLENFPAILETVEFCGIWTFQPKILEILGEKFNWKKTFGKVFLKIWVYLARLSTPNTYYCTVLCFLGLQSWLV